MSRPEDTARAALRRAVIAAEGRDPGPLVAAAPEDFAALEAGAARAEVEGVLMGARPELGLERMAGDGALAALLPEVAALVGFGEGGRQHKDVWDHTKRVVLQSPPRPAVRWAALLHDVGKVPTRKTAASGQVTFHGHAEVGARMARRALARFEMEPDLAERVRLLVLFHLRANQYEPGWTDSAVRRFGVEIGDLMEDLLDLSRADMTTKYREKRRRGLDQIDELRRRVLEVQERDAREPPLPKGFGQLIIERFAMAPGKRIGVYRDSVELAIDMGRIESHQEPEVYLAWLAARQEALDATARGEGPGLRGDADAYLDWLEATVTAG